MYWILSLLMATTFSNSFTAQPAALLAREDDAGFLTQSIFADGCEDWVLVTEKEKKEETIQQTETETVPEKAPVQKDDEQQETVQPVKQRLAPVACGGLPDSIILIRQPKNWWEDFFGKVAFTALQAMEAVKQEAQEVWRDLKTLSELSESS